MFPDINKEANNTSNRYIQIDYAKAFGILLVVLGHVTEEVTRKGINSNFGLQLHNWIYCFHMPLFFILSGLGIFLKYCNNKSIDYSKQIKNISKKLLIPYFVWSFIYLIGASLSAAFINKRSILVTILEKVYAFLTLRGTSPLWFLSALFLTNVVYLWIMSSKCFIEKPILCHLTILSVSLGVTILAQNWFMANKPDTIIILYPIITILRFFPTMFYFEIGYLFGFGWDKIIKYWSMLRIAISFSLFIVLFIFIKLNFKCGMHMHRFEFDNVGIILVLGVLGSLGIIFFCCLLSERLNLLAYIGKNSMDIMILHYPPIPTLRIVFIIFTKIHLSLCFGLMTIITTLLCLVIQKFILKPIINCFK